MKSPLISGFRPPWLEEIAIQGNDSPFLTLPSVTDLVDPVALVDRANEYDIPEGVAEAANRDTYPLPHTEDREHYYGDRHLDYWLSGLQDYSRLKHASREIGIEIESARYFELGCASGRVLRHLVSHGVNEVWCADLNLRHIEWIRCHLPLTVKAFQNTLLPHLPLPDYYFDIVSAFSVFTHIDHFEFGWLIELRRILRPGGLAYFTIASDQVWDKYKQGWIKETLLPMRNKIFSYKIDDDFFRHPLPREKTVFWWPTQTVYNCSVYHHTDYILREWARFFDICEIRRFGHFYQDVVLMRRP